MVVIHEKEAGIKYIWVQWSEKPVRNNLLLPSCFFIAVCSFSSHINKTFHPVNCCSLDVSSSSDQRWLCGMNPRRSAVSEIQHQQPRPIQSHLNHCFSTFSSPVWTPAAHPNHVHGVAIWAMWLANYIIVLMKSWTGVLIKAAIMDMDHYFG